MPPNFSGEMTTVHHVFAQCGGMGVPERRAMAAAHAGRHSHAGASACQETDTGGASRCRPCFEGTLCQLEDAHTVSRYTW